MNTTNSWSRRLDDILTRAGSLGLTESEICSRAGVRDGFMKDLTSRVARASTRGRRYAPRRETVSACEKIEKLLGLEGMKPVPPFLTARANSEERQTLLQQLAKRLEHCSISELRGWLAKLDPSFRGMVGDGRGGECARTAGVMRPEALGLLSCTLDAMSVAGLRDFALQLKRIDRSFGKAVV